MNHTHTCLNEKETEEFAHLFAARILGDNRLVLLKGEPGAGKTTFARALIRYLCKQPDLVVPSPTFTLYQFYEPDIYHFDLYRIEDPEELEEIGWHDILSEAGLVLVEWPEKAGRFLPAGSLALVFTNEHDIRSETQSETMRTVTWTQP